MKKNLQNYFRLLASTAISFYFLLPANASEYTLTFSGSGAGTAIDKVVIQNLTKDTKQTVFSGSTFQLSFTSTAVQSTEADNNVMSVYPNPVIDNSRVSFSASATGNVLFSVTGLDGKNITSITKYCYRGENSFQLSLPQGIYFLNVKGNGFTYTTKAVSQNRSQSQPEIALVGNNSFHGTISKVRKDVVSMDYTPGDHLLFTAYSGNYSTLVTDFNITGDKNIPFVFEECLDASGFNYSTVKIGSQTWMAQDLRTSKYRNGEGILFVYDNWELAATGAYCYNSYAFGGNFYNYLAVADPRNIAPVGWHIPTNDEWATLTSFLGGDAVAGSKMKSTDWHMWTTGNHDATNESGFNALPGGTRNFAGFSGLNTDGTWWSTSEYTSDPTQAWYLNVYCQETQAFRYYSSKKTGLSVRCLKD